MAIFEVNRRYIFLSKNDRYFCSLYCFVNNFRIQSSILLLILAVVANCDQCQGIGLIYYNKV